MDILALQEKGGELAEAMGYNLLSLDREKRDWWYRLTEEVEKYVERRCQSLREEIVELEEELDKATDKLEELG